MSTLPNKYKVFRRSALNFEQFANARKTVIERGLTLEEARSRCDRENANLSDAEKRRGTKYEFTTQ